MHIDEMFYKPHLWTKLEDEHYLVGRNFDRVYIPQRGGVKLEYHSAVIIGWHHIACPQGSGLCWLIQNSWGDTWGTGGFALVASAGMSVHETLRTDDYIFGIDQNDTMLMASFADDVFVDDKIHMLSDSTSNNDRNQEDSSRHIILALAFVLAGIWCVFSLRSAHSQ